MSSQLDPSLRIEVTVKASQPEFLEGLDVWLRLGLLSDAQVRRLSQTYLTCLLPQPEVVATVQAPQVTPAPTSSTDWEVETPVVRTPKPSPVSQMWHSLRDELSVRWLLFLGVFLVVVSSGVLAATQWEKFPAVGQYGVLWAYTLIFWGISFWAGKQRNLQLTAQTLRLVTLLLVPVNFWAMDSFGLWHHPWEWLVVAIAAFTLTANTVLHPDMRNHPSRPTSDALLLLLLSYLHWGWHWGGFPLVAVYIGMVGTAILLPKRYAPSQTPDASTTATRTADDSLTRPQRTIQSDTRTGSSIVIYALTVLLGRAIFGVHLPIAQLGLAIGICGWLFARLGEPIETIPESTFSFKSRIWEVLGGCLLLIGWLVSVGEQFPWQATAVSGLGLLFFAKRLRRYSRRFDLLAIFTIGLQVHWLVWRLVPVVWREEAIAFFTQLTNSQNVPFALVSLALFPYVIGMVILTDWLYRAAKPKLGRFGEQLTFGFGLVLTLISLFNPTLRSLNLFSSTLTLAIVTSRRTPTRTGLVYLTHVTGLLTLGSAIDWIFPNLSQPVWAGILLGAMVIEWGYSVSSRLTSPPTPLLQGEGSITPPFPRREGGQEGLGLYSPIWQRSAWHLGFVLSGLSYTLLWNETYPFGFSVTSVNQQSVLLWLLTPLSLTGVASSSSQPRRKQAVSFSIVALFMEQILTLALPGTRLVSLGIASGLMWVNTRYLQQLAAASITVGFGLVWVGMLLWEGIPGLLQLSEPDWFLVGAIAILVLWLLRSWLLPRNGTLAALYAEASNGWAVALCSFELLMLTLHSIVVYAQSNDALLNHFSGWKYLIACCLILAATLYRQWQQPTNWGIYGISWAVELGIAEAGSLSGGSTLELAVANIILGLVTLIASDWWLSQRRRAISLSSVDTKLQSEKECSAGILPARARRSHYIRITSMNATAYEIVPLLYALLGFALRFGHFTSWTGLLTLGAALTGIGVGRRRAKWKPLTYLSLASISFAWYELVIYQMLQASGGSLADAYTVLAGVAVAIAFAYRLLAWFLPLRSNEGLLSLSVAEIKVTAHIHWAIGSLLMVLAAIIAVETEPHLTGVGIALCLLLAAYALVQGRRNPKLSAAYAWVYIGMIGLAATGVYARLTFTVLSVLDAWRALIACGVAYCIYELPWNRWGWPQTPWKRSGVVLPAFTVLATAEVISDDSLLLVAGFYAWIAQRSSNVRYTYISVVLVDWAIARWFDRLHFTDLLWYATLYGLSLLYIAQFDPGLKQSQQRQIRHYLRILGSGAICVVALLFHQGTGVIPGVISTIAIFAGLILRVRAFLLVGTATFLLTAFYQLVVLISRYSFVKWVVGLIVGIIFIGMAANFENRREQIASVVRHSRNQLGDWD